MTKSISDTDGGRRKKALWYTDIFTSEVTLRSTTDHHQTTQVHGINGLKSDEMWSFAHWHNYPSSAKSNHHQADQSHIGTIIRKCDDRSICDHHHKRIRSFSEEGRSSSCPVPASRRRGPSLCDGEV